MAQFGISVGTKATSTTHPDDVNFSWGKLILFTVIGGMIGAFPGMLNRKHNSDD